MNLSYSDGLLLTNPDPRQVGLEGIFEFDGRLDSWTTLAYRYREILLKSIELGLPIEDAAKTYSTITFEKTLDLKLRKHQLEAYESWVNNKGQGVIELPTGAGKTILAVKVIEYCRRSTLVVVPTIELMHQWASVVRSQLGVQCGLLGGGEFNIQDVTISTYDSAYIHHRKLGSRFGLVVFDECHHLPATQYRIVAETSLAPFRLGLSATVDRQDGKEELIYELLGPKIHVSTINELSDVVLAPYEVKSIAVKLSREEQVQYLECRQTYKSFLSKNQIYMGAPKGWSEFIMKSSYLPGGKDALKAYRTQKKIAQRATAKTDVLWDLLVRHKHDQMIIFTDDNEHAYRLGKEFFLPVLTHHTKTKERKKMLKLFKAGDLSVLVTSKVLNEGVDVPTANVGIVMSGSGVVREHVQRLGRILRHQPGKIATMYEVIALDTTEEYTNKRRRQHDAYKRST